MPTTSCANCHREQPADGPKFARCQKCVSENLVPAAYCCKDCQKNDWPAHKAWHQGIAQMLSTADSETRATIAPKPSASALSTDEYADLLKKGLREVAIGNSLAAVSIFTECIQMRPDQAVAHANLGMALRSAGQNAAAVGPLLKAVQFYKQGEMLEKWASCAATAFFAFASGGGGDAELPEWLTQLPARIAMAEECVVAAPGSMQCWAMLGMGLAEEERDMGRAAQAFMKAASLTDEKATKEGYLSFARGLLQQVKLGQQQQQQQQ